MFGDDSHLGESDPHPPALGSVVFDVELGASGLCAR